LISGKIPCGFLGFIQKMIIPLFCFVFLISCGAKNKRKNSSFDGHFNKVPLNKHWDRTFLLLPN
jgi:hypothetical protein